MKICLVGKFPPIEGGVSARTYWTAHRLAQRGHQVHVVTNASEVNAPYRMFMRTEDWDRCAADYGDGYVRVHWTAPFDRRQWHIPRGSAFVTKLASIGIELAETEGFDVVYSYYAQPYAVAGHLIASATRRPHVIRLAGSDAGRLWRQPQFKPLFDHVFRSATAIVAGGSTARAMVEAGVSPACIRADHDRIPLSGIFTREGPKLDVAALVESVRRGGNPELIERLSGDFRSDRPYFGVYGKLGAEKGTYALLNAAQKLAAAGHNFGLLVMAHPPAGLPNRKPPKHAGESSAVEDDALDFRRAVSDLGLQNRIVQIPFVPHWRVPELIRRCVAICCLEQDFRITFHAPIVAREVMTCGGCLIGSTEVILKLPFKERVIDGFNCIAVSDVNDSDALANALAKVLINRTLAADIGNRAGRYAAEVEEHSAFPAGLERILAGVLTSSQNSVEGEPRRGEQSLGAEPIETTIERLIRIMPDEARRDCLRVLGESPANHRLDTLFQLMKERLPPVSARSADSAATLRNDCSVFRLRGLVCTRETFLGQRPFRRPDLRLLEFNTDPPSRGADMGATGHPPFGTRKLYAACSSAMSGGLSFIEERLLPILQLCDGTRTVAEIASTVPTTADDAVSSDALVLECLERLLEREVIELQPTWSAAVGAD